MTHLLFYTRLLLYLVVVLIPFVHPAILVPYDLPGIGLWLIIVPGMFFLSFYFSPPLLKIRSWLLINFGFLILASLVLGGFTLDALSMLAVGAAAFLLTVLVFKTQGKGRIFAALELFFVGGLYFAFLSFSRSSEEIARASGGILKILFMLAVVTLFVHAVVLFLASFPKVVAGKGKRNILLFLLILIPAVLAISFLVPNDFIIQEVHYNPLQEELERQTKPLDQDSNNPFDGNLRNKTQRDREGRLEGLDGDQWSKLNLLGRGKGGGKQYAVMIVASMYDPLYLGEYYHGDLDPVRGMLISKNEPLNNLAKMRLIETWRNTTPVSDRSRDTANAAIFSTIDDRFSAYRPLSVTPTVFNKDLMPFVFSYEGTYDVSTAAPEELKQAGALTGIERNELTDFLGMPLQGENYTVFKNYVDSVTTPQMTNYEKVIAILKSFKTFQYELGFDENVSIAKLRLFLEQTKTGDCTEFSNSTALLARMAGIPSRVVTGFLATRDLQLPKHRRGLAYLQQKMEPLQKYSLDELVLVTTSHRHAWTEVYISGYGWIDIETTGFAKPPQLGGDPNDWNVVVPLMNKKQGTPEEPAFPWTTVLIVIGIVLGSAVVGVYAVKFGREAVLYAVSRSNTRLGLAAFQRLLLIRLISAGFEYKPKSLTILEYSEKYPPAAGFAGNYTELRYRGRIPKEEKDALWGDLRCEYRKIMIGLKAKVPLVKRIVLRILTLKGFRY
jgi:transglutaminase-like putative cysteine protease